MKIKQFIVEVIIFLYVLLFTYAAGSKLVDYRMFVSQIAKSPLLTNFASFIAWVIPVIEIVIGLLLIIPKFRGKAIYAAFGMMVIFTFYIVAILSFSKELPCSCGGILSVLGWKEHLVFNITFVLLGLIAIILMGEQENDKQKTVSV